MYEDEPNFFAEDCLRAGLVQHAKILTRALGG
jgi:hypothetical protein